MISKNTRVVNRMPLPLVLVLLFGFIVNLIIFSSIPDLPKYYETIYSLIERLHGAVRF